jgi:glycosyltransferase involved in cell wall biosynthesis
VIDDKARPLLTIIVPVFNEKETLDELLRQVVAAPFEKQVVVVDDGSTDGTTALLERWEGHQAVELLQHACNRGKGAVIRTALDHARGQFVIIQDADLEYDPQDYSRLIEPLLKREGDVVYGSRYLGGTTGGRGSRRAIKGSGSAGASPSRSMFRWGVSFLNFCVRLWYGVRLTDEATCYKAFPTSLLRSLDLRCERFEFCPEVTAKVCRMGLRILEVPIHYNPRTVKAGKKIRWKDGLEAIATLWKWRRWKPNLASSVSQRIEFLPGQAAYLGSAYSR